MCRVGGEKSILGTEVKIGPSKDGGGGEDK
jgi:hypothetical protein